MENIVLLIHLLIALAIIGLILMQRGKGAEMGASFGGGASQTLFGASGSGNFFSKMTAIFAFLFFITSFSLAIMAKQKGEAEVFEDEIPAAVEATPAANADDIPEVGEDETAEIPESAEIKPADEIPESGADAKESSEIPEE
ncbi:Protein-export membrane protein SecG [Thalassocella blandensis]|nr:Protein-export membrane protein SecG [Thalassocella blandensis]